MSLLSHDDCRSSNNDDHISILVYRRAVRRWHPCSVRKRLLVVMTLLNVSHFMSPWHVYLMVTVMTNYNQWSVWLQTWLWEGLTISHANVHQLWGAYMYICKSKLQLESNHHVSQLMEKICAIVAKTQNYFKMLQTVQARVARSGWILLCDRFASNDPASQLACYTHFAENANEQFDVCYEAAADIRKYLQHNSCCRSHC